MEEDKQNDKENITKMVEEKTSHLSFKNTSFEKNIKKILELLLINAGLTKAQLEREFLNYLLEETSNVNYKELYSFLLKNRSVEDIEKETTIRVVVVR